MKHVNPKARKVLDILTTDVDKIGDHKKINNSGGAFMPVYVEHVNKCNLGQIFSVTHYYEQNGDLMRDPDMEFIKGGDDEYYPISFWQDSPVVRNEVVVWKDGEITGWMSKEQAELAIFANKWMRNIQEQQGLVM